MPRIPLIGIPCIVELTALIGYYVMVSMALNAPEYGLPAGVSSPLPPRTRKAALR